MKTERRVKKTSFAVRVPILSSVIRIGLIWAQVEGDGELEHAASMEREIEAAGTTTAYPSCGECLMFEPRLDMRGGQRCDREWKSDYLKTLILLWI